MADLNALVIFAMVADAGSFSGAARRLRMPVSSVSRRIAELEDALGVRLMERSTCTLRLTEPGREILVHARQTAEISEAVGLIAANRNSTVGGHLRLSAPPSIAETLLVPIIAEFQRSCPDVRIEVLVTDRYVDHVAEAVDLAFRFGKLRDSALRSRRILTYRHLLVASPDYLRSRPAPQSPAELGMHRLLTFAHWKPGQTWSFEHAASHERVRFKVQPVLAMNDYSGLAAALSEGQGIGELPPIVAPGLLERGELVEVMPEWRLPAHDLSLVHLGNDHAPRASQILADLAVRMAPDLFPRLPV